MGGSTPRDVFDRLRTSFGAIAAEYDAVRPSWPRDTVRWMLGSPRDDAVLRVLDLGAGTGKGTRALARMGHEVLAVEPAEGMLGALAGSLRGLDPELARRVTPLAGSAEQLPLRERSVDAVTVFQAWHWFDTEQAARECARVLRAGGWLSMGWHHRDESVAWSRELSALVDQRDHLADAGDAPDLPGFDAAGTGRFAWTMRQSVDDLVRQAATWSYVATRPDRAEVLDGVRDLGRSAAGRDGVVVIPMTTLAYRLRRR